MFTVLHTALIGIIELLKKSSLKKAGRSDRRQTTMKRMRYYIDYVDKKTNMEHSTSFETKIECWAFIRKNEKDIHLTKNPYTSDFLDWFFSEGIS